MPFELPEHVHQLFSSFTDYNFYLYSPAYQENKDTGHIHQRKISLRGFKADLYSASGVICNARFEPPSECLQLGKRVLVKPLDKQMEQLTNAKALEQLGFGRSMKELDETVVKDWLRNATILTTVQYPDTVAAIAKWILKGEWQDIQTLSDQLWEAVSLTVSNAE